MFVTRSHKRMTRPDSLPGAGKSKRNRPRSFVPQLEALEERRLLYAGALDHTFGADGLSSVDLAFPLGQHASGVAVAIQPDGKIVVAGAAGDQPHREFLVARLNADGSLDTGFDSAGPLPGIMEFNITGTDDSVASGIAVQPDGKIVVVGSCTVSGLSALEAFRLNPDGTVDGSFNGNTGLYQLDDTLFPFLTENWYGHAVALQSDGKIVVAGQYLVGQTNTSRFFLLRLNPDGTPDYLFGGPHFDSVGVQTDFPNGGSFSDYASANSVAIAPDSTIVAGGVADLVDSNGNPIPEFALARYNPDGTPDLDFNGVGRITTAFGGYSNVFSVAVQTDGKILAAGTATGGGHFTLARYFPSGILDAGFGSGGTIETSFPNAPGAGANALALQPDGKIVLAGISNESSQLGGENFALARYNADGSLDQSFNFDGLVTTDYSAGGNDGANAVAILSDGKIVAVGNGVLGGYPVAAVVRYEGDAGQLHLSASNLTVPESLGPEGRAVAALTVTRTGGATGTVTIDYATSDLTANAGADYTSTAGTLTFQDGQTSQTIFVSILDDGALEGGTETFKLTLSNPTGGATLGSQTVAIVSIADPDIVVKATIATEGQPFNGVVATFKGSNPSVAIGDYAAVVNWGDSTTSPGTITPDPNGGFDVTGAHTYAEEGTYPLRVSITGGEIMNGFGQATVADAALTATPIKLVVTNNKNFSGPVATFTDADPGGTASDYSATITWDDGTTSAGTISGAGPFTVSGNHLFSAFSGTHHISVVMNDVGGSSTSVKDNVTDPSLPNSIVAMSSQTGQWWVAQPNGSGFTTSMWATWNPNVTWVDAISGDFTGNGKTDVAARDLKTGNWWVGLSNGSGFTTSLWTTWNPGVTWVDVKAGDFTGDGKFDIVGRVLQTGQWWMAQSTGSSFTNSLWTTWNPHVTWVDVSVGDFNADGLEEIVGRVLQNGQWWVAQSTGSSFTNSLWTTWNPNVSWVDVRVGDFSGDGMEDLVGRVQQTGQWWMAQSTGSTFSNSLWTTWNPNVTWVDVQVGDFTGDGQLDIIGRVAQSGQWWLAQSTGPGFTNHLWGQWSPNVTWVDVQIGDFNGDGKADIAGRIQGTGQWWTSLSTGSGFTNSLWANWSSAATWVDARGGNYA